MTRPFRNRAARGLSLLAVAALAGFAIAPQAASAAQEREKLTREERKERERERKARSSIDNALATAHKDGKTILIVAVPAFKHKYPTEALIDENLADEVTDTGTAAAIDLSMASEWVHTEYPELMIAVGQNLTSTAIGPAGFFYRFEGRKADYLAFLVEPGTYVLRTISYPRPRSSFANRHGTVAARGAGSIGQLRQVASTMLEAEQTTVYLDAITTTVGASEQCNYWYKGVCTQSVYTPEYTEETRAAGLYPRTDYLPIPALDVSIRLTGDVASFSTGAGEVVLVDGLFAEPLETQLAVSNCRTGESMQVCALQALDLTRAAGSLDELRSYDFAAAHFPLLGQLVAAAQHRPLNLNATALGRVTYGERFRAEAR